MGIKVITPAAALIGIAELRLHLKLDGDPHADDDLITDTLLPAAAAYCEHATGRSFGSQTLELALDEFPATVAIVLPRGPVTSIVSVKYIDADQVEQTLDGTAYTLDDYSDPQFVLPAYSTDWPDSLATANAVKVRYVAGAAVLPAAVRAALKLLVGHWYEHREEVAQGNFSSVPLGVDALLATVKDYSGAV